MKKGILTFILFCAIFLNAYPQDSVFGTWKTIDDKTGDAKSYIELYKKDNKLFGKITKLLEAEQDATCEECKGKKKDKPLVGMIVVENLEWKGDRWEDGKILDPESGNTYNCKIWVDEDDANVLKVRGIHWTGIYRTQEWKLVSR